MHESGMRYCLMQMYGEHALRHGVRIPDAGARLSLTLANDMSMKQGYKHLVYGCPTRAFCSKPHSLANACFKQNCSYIFYIDSDVFVHDPLVNVIKDVSDAFPEAVVTMGIDYRRTMLNPKWKDGSDRWYRTDSNAGMSVVKCDAFLTQRVLVSWGHLCEHFSPYKSDQEAIQMLETLPQYQRRGIFARDVLFLGQYSLSAKHFPGDSGKNKNFPIPSDFNYTSRAQALQQSGMFKWMVKYWSTLNLTIPETEAWRLSPHDEVGWTWDKAPILNCTRARPGANQRNTHVSKSYRDSRDSRYIQFFGKHLEA